MEVGLGRYSVRGPRVLCHPIWHSQPVMRFTWRTLGGQRASVSRPERFVYIVKGVKTPRCTKPQNRRTLAKYKFDTEELVRKSPRPGATI